MHGLSRRRTTHPQVYGVYRRAYSGSYLCAWRQDLSTNTPPVPNRLLEAEAFAAQMGQFGVDAATTVIVYDPGDGNWAARIWWALKYYGHDQVYVLHGGAAAWHEAGHPWTTAVIQPPPTTLSPATPAMRATKAQVLHAVHDSNTTILETRQERTIADAGGTVQGAFWLPSTTVYAANGAYRELIPEAGLDRYLSEIGANRAAVLVAT